MRMLEVILLKSYKDKSRGDTIFLDITTAHTLNSKKICIIKKDCEEYKNKMINSYENK